MDEIKIQAMLAELEQQRNWAQTRCAQLAGEMATLGKKIADLEEQIKPDKKEE